MNRLYTFKFFQSFIIKQWNVSWILWYYNWIALLWKYWYSFNFLNYFKRFKYCVYLKYFKYFNYFSYFDCFKQFNCFNYAWKYADSVKINYPGTNTKALDVVIDTNSPVLSKDDDKTPLRYQIVVRNAGGKTLPARLNIRTNK